MLKGRVFEGGNDRSLWLSFPCDMKSVEDDIHNGLQGIVAHKQVGHRVGEVS